MWLVLGLECSKEAFEKVGGEDGPVRRVELDEGILSWALGGLIELIFIFSRLRFRLVATSGFSTFCSFLISIALHGAFVNYPLHCHWEELRQAIAFLNFQTTAASNSSYFAVCTVLICLHTQ